MSLQLASCCLQLCSSSSSSSCRMSPCNSSQLHEVWNIEIAVVRTGGIDPFHCSESNTCHLRPQLPTYMNQEFLFSGDSCIYREPCMQLYSVAVLVQPVTDRAAVGEVADTSSSVFVVTSRPVWVTFLFIGSYSSRKSRLLQGNNSCEWSRSAMVEIALVSRPLQGNNSCEWSRSAIVEIALVSRLLLLTYLLLSVESNSEDPFHILIAVFYAVPDTVFISSSNHMRTQDNKLP
jgi:hypothetical protein